MIACFGIQVFIVLGPDLRRYRVTFPCTRVKYSLMKFCKIPVENEILKYHISENCAQLAVWPFVMLSNLDNKAITQPYVIT